MAHLLGEAHNGHGIHCVPEGFPIIHILQAEDFAAYQVVEGGPAPFKPAKQQTEDLHLGIITILQKVFWMFEICRFVSIGTLQGEHKKLARLLLCDTIYIADKHGRVQHWARLSCAMLCCAVSWQ